MPKSELYGMPARYLATPPILTNGAAVPLLVNINGALITSSSNGAFGPITITGTSGTMSINSSSDGGEYNISVDTTGTLAIFGSGAQTLNVNLLDGALLFNSVTRITSAGVFFPAQAATVSAPAYVKGGMYFDTTLNKMRIGGATAWETVTSV